jgi:hypothetical protein
MQTMDIMYACVILNNMIIEDEARSNLEFLFEVGQATQMKRCLTFQKLNEELKYIQSYFNLRTNLVDLLVQ